MYDLAVVIGRFQPLHNGHLALLKKASEIAYHTLVIVGSANQPRTIKNPFTADERMSLLNQTGLASVITSVEDSLYSENQWVRDIQEEVYNAIVLCKARSVAIVGHEKDSSSYYVKAFPEWDFVDAKAYGEGVGATKVRDFYFGGLRSFIRSVVPNYTLEFLNNFAKTQEYINLVDEYNYINMYKEQWSVAPYPVTFFTVDSVVVQSGNLLLVKRRAAPGKGLWALPGGFINQDETAEESALRELREETRIKVPRAVLKGSIKKEKLFDAPGRSLRGRTITQAFLIELPPQEKLPVVKGADDAEEARWFTLSEVKNMTSELFEDHASIIKTMVN